MATAAHAVRPDVLSISAPRNNATVVGPAIVVSGYADAGTVTVRVFRGNERVFADQLTVNNGRWKTAPFKLNNGNYSVSVEQGTAAKTTKFTVASSKGLGFVSPGNGDQVAGPNIGFSGVADAGKVTLRIYKEDNLVFERELNAKEGAWSTSYRMADGLYHAEVVRGSATRSIDFRVGTNPNIKDVTTGSAFNIESPRDGSTVTGQSVTFDGRATAALVSVRLYDGDTPVYQGAVNVKNGRWSMSRDMAIGAHTVVVQEGELVRTAKFTVQPSTTIKPAPPLDIAAIGTPKNGATLKGPRVKFTGTASTPSVGVYIYQGDKRVFESSQGVKKGRWAFTTTLAPGSYRLEITAGKGHATIEVKVQ